MSATHSDVHSRYHAHPVLGPLVREFMRTMPAESELVTKEFATLSLADLTTHCHRLGGTAATYGFDALTKLALSAESLARRIATEPEGPICEHGDYAELSAVVASLASLLHEIGSS